MRALLHDAPPLDHGDAVGAHDGGQAVRDDHRRPPLHQLVQRVLHHALALRIECTRGLVQQEHAGILDDGAGNRDALLLAAAHLRALLADVGVVALGQALDEGVRVGRLGGGNHLGHRRPRLAVADVFGNRGRKQRGLLFGDGMRGGRGAGRRQGRQGGSGGQLAPTESKPQSHSVPPMPPSSESSVLAPKAPARPAPTCDTRPTRPRSQRRLRLRRSTPSRRTAPPRGS